MARPKGGKPSTSGIFKQYFAEKPELLQISSLDEVITRFQQEHPNVAVDTKLRQIAANVKSTLKRKGGGTGKKRGRPKGSGKAAVMAAPVAAAARSGATLERLEDKIDDCLSLAREVDPRGLNDIIRQLRRALAGVILRIEDR